MAALLCCTVFGLLIYIYFLYPGLLWVWAACFGRQPTIRDDDLPGLTMIIAAHNEEAVIEEKILNCLHLDYPREKLEILIASDGSVDGTNTMARRYADRGITLCEYPRGGKVRALNQTVPRARHDVLIFSDANTMYQPDSLRQLVRYLGDDQVGAVTGDVRLLNPHATLGKPEGLYFKYERF